MTDAPKMLSADDVRAMLREACEAAGGQKAWALAHNMSANLPGMFLRGKRGVPPTVARALKLTTVSGIDGSHYVC